VAPSERRATDATPPGVDNNIAAQFHRYNVKAQYALTDRVQIFGHAAYFHENRDNGKASTYDQSGNYLGNQTEEANDTTWKTTSVGTRIQLPDQSSLQATLFTDNESFHSNFLAVPAANPARSIGRISLDQIVPTKGVGGMVQWTRSLSRNQVITAGADTRWVEGESQETAFNSQVNIPTRTVQRMAGGSQKLSGAFVQDIITPTSRLQLTLSARVDHWRNYNAHFLETTIATGAPTANNKSSCSAAAPTASCLADRTDTVTSPRAAALYHLTNAVSVWGDFGYGFRAPTLNELYRQFSVGAVVTRANSDLRPERLKGGEVGVNITPMSNLDARVTWFDNRVKDPVANVTIGNNLQQRQNMGRTRIAGIQTDLSYRINESFRVTGGYLYERAKVVEFPANPVLVDNCPGLAAAGMPNEACFLAQVPKSRASARVVYANPKYATVALGVQFLGSQFDEDQNSRFIPTAALTDAGYDATASDVNHPGMPSYTLVDLMASRPIGRNFEVFVSAENLLNKDYFVGTLPTLLGPPRLITGGFRVRWQGK
jgi:outer membrane receptor protein involved in Fe transport